MQAVPSALGTLSRRSLTELDVLLAKAKQGDVKATFCIGMHYEQTPDYDKTVHYFTKAADLGDQAAQMRLTALYLGGTAHMQKSDDHPVNHALASKYCKMAITNETGMQPYRLFPLLNKHSKSPTKDDFMQYHQLYAADPETFIQTAIDNGRAGCEDTQAIAFGLTRCEKGVMAEGVRLSYLAQLTQNYPKHFGSSASLLERAVSAVAKANDAS